MSTPAFRPARALLQIHDFGQVTEPKRLASKDRLANRILWFVRNRHKEGILHFHDQLHQVEAVTAQVFNQSTCGVDFIAMHAKSLRGNVTDTLLDTVQFKPYVGRHESPAVFDRLFVIPRADHRALPALKSKLWNHSGCLCNR